MEFLKMSAVFHFIWFVCKRVSVSICPARTKFIQIVWPLSKKIFVESFSRSIEMETNSIGFCVHRILGSPKISCVFLLSHMEFESFACKLQHIDHSNVRQAEILHSRLLTFVANFVPLLLLWRRVGRRASFDLIDIFPRFTGIFNSFHWAYYLEFGFKA